MTETARGITEDGKKADKGGSSAIDTTNMSATNVVAIDRTPSDEYTSKRSNRQVSGRGRSLNGATRRKGAPSIATPKKEEAKKSCI